MATPKIVPTMTHRSAVVAEEPVSYHAFQLLLTDHVLLTLVSDAAGEVDHCRIDLVPHVDVEIGTSIVADSFSRSGRHTGRFSSTGLDVREGVAATCAAIEQMLCSNGSSKSEVAL